MNKNTLVSIFNDNKDLSITNVTKFTNWLETLSGDNVKWKKNTSANQVVLRTDKYYYKVYAFDEIDKYGSIIRHALAEIYQSYGIYWEILTFKTETGYIDIECREILPIVEHWTDEILLNYAHTLRLLEKKLNFEDILKQIQTEYKYVKKLKLIRVCINKPEDYARFKDKVILLDDADWAIVMIDINNKPIGIINPLIKLKLYDEDFIFTSLILKSKHMLTTDKLNEFADKFYIFKDVDIIKKNTQLKQEMHHMFDKNLQLLLQEDSNILDKEDVALYTNNAGKKSFQWELWQYCNSLCKFCFLGDVSRSPDKQRQLTSLLDLSNAIDKLDFNVYNNISLIGGEFFQGQLNDPEIHDIFFSIIKKIFNLYLDKQIGSIWITTVLTIGDQKHLYELLDLAKYMGIQPVDKYGASGLWLCTSWDAEGRFHTQQMKSNWEYHMKNIKNKYPWIKLITNILLTQPFIDLYLDNKFKPKEFMKEYNTSLFYNCCAIPGIHTPEHYKLFATMNSTDMNNILIQYKLDFQKKTGMKIFPTRSSFIKFLTKYHNDDPDTYDRLFNMLYKPDEKYKHFENEMCNLKMNIKHNFSVEGYSVPVFTECGHNKLNFAPYIDSNKCALCDKKMFE